MFKIQNFDRIQSLSATYGVLACASPIFLNSILSSHDTDNVHKFIFFHRKTARVEFRPHPLPATFNSGYKPAYNGLYVAFYVKYFSTTPELVKFVLALLFSLSVVLDPARFVSEQNTADDVDSERRLSLTHLHNQSPVLIPD